MPVVHCKRSPYDIYIGRPGEWGNPFTERPNVPNTIRVDSREEAIRLYEHVFLPEHPELIARLPGLRGKVLGCWCAPRPCHGDVLVRLADVD